MAKVTSKDGTQIAFDQRGTGPALIPVSGALGYRGAGFGDELVDLLSKHFTVYYYDRRGRGESGDRQPFALEREVEDIDALINAAGGAAFVYGVSSGACLALEAALRLDGKIKRLALYEPPYMNDESARKPWQEYRQKLAQFLADGRRGDAVVLFMKFVGTPAEMIEGMRQAPVWPALEAVAPTLPYDAEAMGEDRSVPVQRAAKVSVPTLIMDGGADKTIMPFMGETAAALAKAMPNGQRRTLEGQTHAVQAAVLAPVLIEFFKS